MVYAKRYKRRYKKSNYKGVSKAVKYYVNRQIAGHTENKLLAYNTQAEFNVISTTWTELNTTNIAQGLTVINRVGRQVKLKSLEIDMLIEKADATNIFRVIIGLFSGQLTTPLQTGAATISQAITRNTLNGLIKKYLDRYIVCDGVKQSIAHFKYFKKFTKPVYITWASDAANQDKKLFVSILSDSGAIAHPLSTAGRINLRFEDA